MLSNSFEQRRVGLFTRSPKVLPPIGLGFHVNVDLRAVVQVEGDRAVDLLERETWIIVCDSPLGLTRPNRRARSSPGKSDYW